MSQNLLDTAPASDDVARLNPREILLRQQLNILHYWSNRKKTDSPHNTDAEALPHPAIKDFAEDVGLERWNLTLGLEPREWQLRCVEAWTQAGGRGVAKVVTGAGKSIMACQIIERLQNNTAPDLRVAIVVPTMVLLDQWYNLLCAHSNLPVAAIGRLSGEHRNDFDQGCRILICVLNSASTKLPRLTENLPHPLLLIVDECHRAGASRMSEVFRTNRDYSLGLSATPEREVEPAMDDADSPPLETDPDEGDQFKDAILGQELGPIVFELDYPAAIEAGILAQFELNHYGLPFNPKERARYDQMSREITDLRRKLQKSGTGRNFNGGQLVGFARKLATKTSSPISGMASKYVALTGQRKQLIYHAEARLEAVDQLVNQAINESASARILIFHESIPEVMRIFNRLRQRGLAVAAEHSQLLESLRAESLNLFREGVAQILVSARSLIEGFDVPAADVGIVVASSSSVRQRIQTLGRILRKKKEDDHAARLHVLYMADSTDEVIYEKVDWAALTGAKRNRYFIWDPAAPVLQLTERQSAPRAPKPDELQIDLGQLKPGDLWPGAYLGEDFSSDAQGNVRNLEKRVANNPQEVPAVILDLRGNHGRFRVTPKRRAILIPREGGSVLYGGVLKELFDFKPTQSDAEWFEIKSKSKSYRIARSIKDGILFARTRENARNEQSGLEAEQLALKIQELEQHSGSLIRKIRITADNRALVDLKGQAVLLMQLEAGLEFPDSTRP